MIKLNWVNNKQKPITDEPFVCIEFFNLKTNITLLNCWKKS